MKATLINPFINAGLNMLEQIIGGKTEQGKISIRSTAFTTQEISIVVGVSGLYKGQVIYGLSQVTAMKIVSAMMAVEHLAFDEMAVSAVSELGNIISGHAMALLAENNITCDISPPTIIRGTNIELTTHVPSLLIPFHTKCGRIDISVALSDGND